jgi:hypothetical protein
MPRFFQAVSPATHNHYNNQIRIKKAVESTSKEGKRGQRSLSPRSREVGNSSCTTLLQGIPRIGTKPAMKNHRKTLDELTTQVLQKESTEGEKYTR